MGDRTHPRLGFGRRAAMLAGLSGIAAPWLARAQATTPISPPQVIVPPAPVVTPPRPAAPASPVTAIDKDKIYYVFFDQGIDVNSMRALRRQLAVLVEAGVTQIVLVINSSGGQIFPALITYSFIRSLPARIDTHAQGAVASAATLLFLAGEGRSADHGAIFLFHPSQTLIPGLLNEQQIQDQLMQVDSVKASTDQIYRSRTKLTEEQVRSFNQGEIIYTADPAQQPGVGNSVSVTALPGGQTAKILFLD